ncbi:MAG: PadR family transcriptional regulator [Desulfobacteraceae bacterium]|nr:PadR family transcriptional regulator [Desulfobacteraceae bacterium]MBC2756363.1 PadR family transcriptional regulator [Desulfobacteraceae bacterium]
MLKYALLGFLKYNAKTGYELKQTMDTSTSHFWHAKQSQIYTTLKKLEEAGQVSSLLEHQESRPDRRVYTITESGIKALQEWLAKPVTDPETVKHTLLLKLFFSANQEKQFLLAQLGLQRTLHEQQMEHYQSETKDIIKEVAASVPALKQDAHMWEATRRFGELYEEMNLKWINETISMLQKKF